LVQCFGRGKIPPHFPFFGTGLQIIKLSKCIGYWLRTLRQRFFRTCILDANRSSVKNLVWKVLSPRRGHCCVLSISSVFEQRDICIVFLVRRQETSYCDKAQNFIAAICYLYIVHLPLSLLSSLEVEIGQFCDRGCYHREDRERRRR
jgi:hypothetical protein